MSNELWPLSQSLPESSAHLLLVLATVLIWRLAKFPDIGIQGTFALGMCLLLWAQSHIDVRWIVPIVIGGGVLVGIFVGCLYVAFASHFRLNSLISGIFFLFLLRGVATLIYSADRSGYKLPPLPSLIPWVFTFAIVSALILGVRSRVGRKIRFGAESPGLLTKLGQERNAMFSQMAVCSAGHVLAFVGGAVAAAVKQSGSDTYADMLIFRAIGSIVVGEAIVAVFCWMIFRRNQRSRLSSDLGLSEYLIAALAGLVLFDLLIVIALEVFPSAQTAKALVTAGALSLSVLFARLARFTQLGRWKFQ